MVRSLLAVDVAYCLTTTYYLTSLTATYYLTSLTATYSLTALYPLLPYCLTPLTPLLPYSPYCLTSRTPLHALHALHPLLPCYSLRAHLLAVDVTELMEHLRP